MNSHRDDLVLEDVHGRNVHTMTVQESGITSSRKRETSPTRFWGWLFSFYEIKTIAKRLA